MMELLISTLIAPDGRVKPIWYVWAGSSLVCLWLFFWWSVGMFPTSAFGNGFAKAEDVTEIRVQLIEAAVLDHRIAQCGAKSENVRYYYARQLQERVREYEELTGQNMHMPQCNELVG